jgi:hypothetical protein
MSWLKKLFSKDKPLRVYITDKPTPEQEAMWREQKCIQTLLGFEHGDSDQNWLRVHQILLDHEERLKHLETLLEKRND